MTLQALLEQWDATYGIEFGMTLEFAATDERQGYVALEDTDAEITQQRIEIITSELRKYPASLRAKTNLSVLRMVKGNKFWGRAGGRYIIINVVPLRELPKITHHELMHVFDQTSPIWGSPSSPHPDWKNPEGFTYRSGWTGMEGFVSAYAKTAYREDLADTAAFIWARQFEVTERCKTDELLRNKCKAVVTWWSSEGLTQFNDLFGVQQKAELVTERIAGSSRYETAVEVSKARFPGTAPVVYLASAADFPDALVAGTLAVDGPLLLVPPTGTAPSAVLEEVRRLQPGKIVTVGGTASVSAEMQEAVSNAAR